MDNSQLFENIPTTVGDYILLESIGSGAFSRVYLAAHQKTNEHIVIKIVSKNLVKTTIDHAHIQREIDVMQQLSHPNIVSFYGFSEDEYNIYLMMEYIKGMTLLSFVNESSVLPETTVSRIFLQLMRAISYLHQNNIAHRDLKLENIMIDEYRTIKVLDFGFCNFVNENQQLFTTYCGSLNYAAPEIINQMPYKGMSADVWSLGVIFYALLTAELPWPTENMHQMVNCIKEAKFVIPFAVSPRAADLLKKLLVVEPEERITSAEIMAHPFLAGNVVTSHSATGKSLSLSSNSFCVGAHTNQKRRQRSSLNTPQLRSSNKVLTESAVASRGQRTRSYHHKYCFNSALLNDRNDDTEINPCPIILSNNKNYSPTNNANTFGGEEDDEEFIEDEESYNLLPLNQTMALNNGFSNTFTNCANLMKGNCPIIARPKMGNLSLTGCGSKNQFASGTSLLKKVCDNTPSSRGNYMKQMRFRSASVGADNLNVQAACSQRSPLACNCE